ncbi:hypothetical protein [Marinomonas sp. GJ51-6]|uniref:hypothetical protein n=1 Tax=Marinomonas sp. GJ51-6 TaxID=2992802 RepID=UPI002934F063|nr:hypothetical protein [Marinomonas sp. GJ51-6]WOD06526.1 hypothetical protein ONZ50_12620 [Marinomonas sp. GJ51-6]
MKVIFDTKSLYYLPQYLPVHNELLKLGVTTIFVFYESIHNDTIRKIAKDNELSFKWVEDDLEASKFYQQEKADWVFFANTFSYLDDLHKVSKSAQLGHGI